MMSRTDLPRSDMSEENSLGSLQHIANDACEV